MFDIFAIKLADVFHLQGASLPSSCRYHDNFFFFLVTGHPLSCHRTFLFSPFVSQLVNLTPFLVSLIMVPHPNIHIFFISLLFILFIEASSHMESGVVKSW
ncbi:hypothetical protein BGX38DRAFT_701526 [Terfezia claveryi]|nr:hypothetical protein BGX38DRAFT_701526 [Terfezia claveryi]